MDLEKRFDSAAEIWLSKTQRILESYTNNSESQDISIASYLCEKVLDLDAKHISKHYCMFAEKISKDIKKYNK